MSGGTHRCMVGKNGLIKVDLMPTLEGEITPILGTRTPF